MSLLIPFDVKYLPAFSKNWGLFVIWGLVLFILGLFAISASAFTTIISVAIVGFLIFLAGIVITVDTFTFWWKKWTGFFIHLIYSILYLCVGIMLIKNPVEGSISLTLLLGIFYVIAGMCRLVFSSTLKTPNWGWATFNGVITLLIGILILSSWPASSLFIIGLFIGIDLLFTGWAYMMMGFAAKSLAQK